MKVSVTEGGKTVRNEIFFLLLVLCGNPVNLFLVRIQIFVCICTEYARVFFEL